MDENARQYLSAVIDTLEYFWLENQAAKHLLERYEPGWFELIHEYCERPEAKALAQKRFALARAVIRQAQTDSAALEALASALGTPEKSQN